MRKSTLASLLIFIAGFCCRPLEGAAPLSALDQFVVSQGYGGAQFVPTGNTYRLPIKANGKVGDLTIDTGSPNTIVFTASVKKFGLQPKATNFPVHGAFGKGTE